jgi:RIO kinase 2
MKRGHVKTVLGKIGVGKESDIYSCVNEQGINIVLKLARLIL